MQKCFMSPHSLNSNRKQLLITVEVFFSEIYNDVLDMFSMLVEYYTSLNLTKIYSEFFYLVNLPSTPASSFRSSVGVSFELPCLSKVETFQWRHPCSPCPQGFVISFMTFMSIYPLHMCFNN